MDDFLKNLKTVMAPYKVGSQPGYLKTNGEAKQLSNRWDDNEVKASALRDKIRKDTGGKVEVTDSVNNEQSLLGILKSYMQMKNHGEGNLLPNNVIVFDPYPNRVTFGGIVGQYWPEQGTEKSRDPIAVRNTSWGGKLDTETDESGNRFHPVKDGSAMRTITHELAHGAQFNYDDAASRYLASIDEDAKKYDKKYSSSDLIRPALAEVKYALPKVFDTVFGTHIVPTYKEWTKMTSETAAKFWEDYFDDEALSIGSKMRLDAMDKYSELLSKQNKSNTSQGIFEQAAKNTGFNSVDEANASISEYAATNWNEAFAEAYSDVLLNGDKAKPYSKELIRLYSEAADKWAKDFKDDVPMQVDMLKKLMDVSPLKKALVEK